VPFHRHVLPNGLTIIGETMPSSRSVALGFFVKTGSRDESSDESGVSHFLEHMVFKGTPKRSALQVNVDFDRIGADYNAFTSEENTVFYAAVLPEYLPQATDILADILRPSLRTDDFDMEKKVIIEEIGMYDDKPTWCAYDHARKQFFADHPLGNSILGTPQSITDLTADQMRRYFDRRYIGSNITAVAAGNFDFDAFVKLVEDRCKDWPKGEAPRQRVYEAKPNPAFGLMTRDKVTQEHVYLISPGPMANSPLRFAAETLSMVLGDDSNSRLYWSIVDPGLAESADVSFHEYEGAGTFFTSFSSDPENVEEILSIIRAEFAKVQSDGITEAELATAKSKVLSRIVRGSERPMGRMQALGMHWTYQGAYRSVDEDLRDFDAVTLGLVRETLDRYPLTNPAVFALGPLKEVARP
jgi:predicted Zn-dependent peptidase